MQNHIHYRADIDGLRALRPDKVVLTGDWIFHDWKQLTKTIDHLKTQHAQNIILLGTLPIWNQSLKAQITKHVKQSDAKYIPIRLKHGIDSRLHEDEPLVANLALTRQIRYVSLFDILCNEGGCLTQIGDALTTQDNAHPTKAASEYIASKISLE